LISTQAYQRENAREREHKGRAPTQRRNGNVKLGLLALSLCQRRLRCSLNHLEPIQTFASCHSISSAHPSTSTCVFAPCERESHVKREQRKNTAHYHYQFPYSHIPCYPQLSSCRVIKAFGKASARLRVSTFGVLFGATLALFLGAQGQQMR